MSQLIKDIIEIVGYPGIAFLTFVENVFPPIPSEVIIPYAGYFITDSSLTLTGVIISGSLGSLLGAYPLYYLGKIISEDDLKNFLDRYGRWLMVLPSDIDKASAWFEKRGHHAVFIARLVPGLRSLISIPAGFAEMNLMRFTILTLSGTALWTALLAWAGMQLGSRYSVIGDYLDPITYVIFGGVLIGYLLYVYKHRVR